MAETKYGKYIQTSAELPKAQGPIDSTFVRPMTRIDDEVIKGAFHLGCLYFLRARDEGTPDKPHTHDYDEIVAFYGSNPEDPNDLGGEIEIWLGDEKHILTKSCAIFIPKGLQHCPLYIRRLDYPIFHFYTMPAPVYNKKELES